MPSSAVVDSRPIDYRAAHLCAAVLAPDVRATLGAAEGDVVRIATERGRSVLCRVSGPVDEPGAGGVRIDRFTRQALKAYPHEQVTLERVEPAPARELALVPGLDMSQRFDPQLVPALRRLLTEQRVAVRPGMLLYVRMPDAMAGVTYEVHFVAPVGGDGTEGVVTGETTIWMVQDDHHHGPGDHEHDHDKSSETVLNTTFEDVGGLTAQIREVREFVELPLIFPQVYRQLGINPPRGVIFHGAPGTGKTLLARSVANEINAELFYINGPEVVGTFSGETEANLRKIFAEASLNPPSIIFVDELDAIAPARRMATSTTEARTVTQLLALLDGLKQAEGVLVIGTTNRVEAIDPALRRAGRFDREIHFPTPGTEAREQILRVQTREMPLDDDALAGLSAIAERAYGFVGADIMELSREAGLNALRRASTRFVESPSMATYPDAAELVVSRGDFDAALGTVQPAAMRESLITYPRVTWADIGGLEQVKIRLRDLVEKPLRHPEVFERIGLSSNLGVLLYGPPGTGKTLLAQAIAREAGVNFLPINGPELFSQWLGESEESVRRVFDVARRAAPCIVFFDQLDAVVPKRSDLEHEGTRAPQRVVNQLLAELDGMAQRSQVLVIGATNRMNMVDPAALRPGRFGVHLHVGPPDEAGRAEILRIHLAGTALDGDLTLDRMVEHLVPRTAGMTGADLAFLVQNAKLAALDLDRAEPNPRLDLATFDAVLLETGPTG
ncbi:AAA family ATPase [Blastococcus haudaquaticus]|uniref:Transitional endoplasmic reticulum ATPase n=1 Tax=Blastococcus haudaquaticus TaxID=1938745 RepID=A0A286GGP1_9ACTN|nr:AAA family ATPase [Blastococcus haudaquaticus]SOD94668.1 transitional endoplasmic reticulum ATPase [Blastococcus haudaquaticus]